MASCVIRCALCTLGRTIDKVQTFLCSVMKTMSLQNQNTLFILGETRPNIGCYIEWKKKIKIKDLVPKVNQVEQILTGQRKRYDWLIILLSDD